MSLYWFFLFSWFFPSSFILKSLEHPKIRTPNPRILIKFTDTRSIAWFRLSLSRNSRTPYCFFKFTIFSISARLAVLHTLSKHPLSRDSDSPFPEILALAIVFLNLPHLPPYLLDLLCYMYFRKPPLSCDVVRTIINDVEPIPWLSSHVQIQSVALISEHAHVESIASCYAHITDAQHSSQSTDGGDRTY